MTRLHCLQTALISGLLVVLTAACSSPTKQPTGHLELLAKTVSEQPIEGASVILTPGAVEQTTDAVGRARFDNLSLGEYSLTIAHGNYEEWTGTAKIEKNVTTDLTATLTGRPGSLTVTAIAGIGLQQLEGRLVKITDPIDQSVLGQGVTGSNGQVAFAELPAKWVRVEGDTLDNLRPASRDVLIPPNGSASQTLTYLRFASRFSGTTRYLTSTSRNLRIFQSDAQGTTLTPIGPTVSYLDDYDVMITATGHLGVALFGNLDPFEMGAMFSPVYDLPSYEDVTPPLADGRVFEALPRDEQEFTPADFPITLRCETPAAASTVAQWQVFYWWYDGADWQYSHIASSPVNYYSPSWNWNGSVTVTSSPIYGQPLPVSQEGEYYSWWLLQLLSNDQFNFTFDYFFVLKSEGEQSLAARRAPAGIDPGLREAAQSTMLDRAASTRPPGMLRRR
jgi:hypothetical protein